MKVELENFIIRETTEFFFDMKLTNGRESRHRSRVVKALNEHLDDVNEELKELIKQHSNLDEDGEPKRINEGREYDIKDIEAFTKDRTDLLNEKFVLEGSNLKAALKTVRKILDEYEGELQGRKAVVYEHLCNAFKVDEEIDED